MTRFQINITYQCNLRCKWCIQFQDVLDWEDPDIEPEDLAMAGRMAIEDGLKISMLRVSGGEPTLHPRFEDCYHAIRENWPTRERWMNKLIICSNRTNRVPKLPGICPRYSAPGGKTKRNHQPQMLSPTDLGVEPKFGWKIPCKVQRRCGRLFDKYGFAPCGNASGIGRLLGFDPYDAKPVMFGREEMCKHCLASLTDEEMRSLCRRAKAGEISHPTKTWWEGIERESANPTKLKTFRERLAGESA